jgi:hypothetical protein
LDRSGCFGRIDGVMLANSLGDFSELESSQNSGNARKRR